LGILRIWNDARIITNDDGEDWPMKGNALISVRVPADVAKRLAALAKATDRSKSYVAAHAIEEYLTLQEWQIKAIQQGVDEADAGKLVDHSEAVQRLSKWGRRGS